VANRGDGPLEIRPQNDAGSGTTLAFQRIFTHDEAGTWSLAAETEVGTFVFHPKHDHWHLKGFARYEVVNGRGKVVRSSGKVSFCLVDSVFVAEPPPHHAPWAYTGACSQDEVQGISAGWGDVYSWRLPDQSIDITGLPNGRYRLRSTADPFNRIRETDNTNNASVVRFRLRGRQILLD
jgi:hypothetical protein